MQHLECLRDLIRETVADRSEGTCWTLTWMSKFEASFSAIKRDFRKRGWDQRRKPLTAGLSASQRERKRIVEANRAELRLEAARSWALQIYGWSSGLAGPLWTLEHGGK